MAGVTQTQQRGRLEKRNCGREEKKDRGREESQRHGQRKRKTGEGDNRAGGNVKGEKEEGIWKEREKTKRRTQV